VSTDVGGVRDVIDDAVLGAIAPDNDVPALAAHVGRMLAADMRTAATIARRRASVMGRYGSDRLLSDVERLYRDVLG
jgi:glycosyltransferase involved in cell wall biosynthesis